jgi:predicted transcriptional regulator
MLKGRPLLHSLKLRRVPTRPQGWQPTAAQVRKAERLYVQERLPACRVARVLGVSECSLRRWLKQRGLLRPWARWEPDPDQEAEIMRLYGQERLSVTDVAARLGLEMTAVWRFLRRRGIVIEKGRGNRPGRKPLPRELGTKAGRLRAEGLTWAEIAARLGLAPCTVSKLLRGQLRVGRGGRRRWEPPKGQLAEMVRLSGEGWSLGRLGERYGRSPNTIARLLREAGVAISGRGRPKSSSSRSKGRCQRSASVTPPSAPPFRRS